MELKKTEKQEHSIVALTIEVTEQELQSAKDKAFKKQGKNISIPGFRKGKAPRRMVERLYGEDMFFEDAINILSPDALDMALKEADIKAVGRTDIEIGDAPENGGVAIIAKVPVMPEVTLKEYKGLSVKKTVPEVSDADITVELDLLANRNARSETVERPAAEKDNIILDYKGFVDEEPFEGGEAENFKLTLGSHTFIPGFEEQLIGCSAGEEKTIDVMFPEDYRSAELAGKAAKFECKIHRVEAVILPELDDEFAKDVSETCDTLDELKKEISDRILKERTEQSNRKFEDDLLVALSEQLEADIPNAMIEQQVDRRVQDFSYQLQMRGMELNRYLELCGMDIDQLRRTMRSSAEQEVKNRLALEKVSELENVEISDEKTEEEFSKLAEQYEMEVDKIKEAIAVEDLKADLKVTEALEIVKNNAQVEEIAWGAATETADEAAAE